MAKSGIVRASNSRLCLLTVLFAFCNRLRLVRTIAVDALADLGGSMAFAGGSAELATIVAADLTLVAIGAGMFLVCRRGFLRYEDTPLDAGCRFEYHQSLSDTRRHFIPRRADAIASLGCGLGRCALHAILAVETLIVHLVRRNVENILVGLHIRRRYEMVDRIAKQAAQHDA